MFPSQGRDEGPTPSTRTKKILKRELLQFSFLILVLPQKFIFYSSLNLINSFTPLDSRTCFTRLLNSENGTLIEV